MRPDRSPPPRARRRDRDLRTVPGGTERGSVTVLFAGLVVAALVLALALGGLARATHAHARAQGVADLAALAAARDLAHTGGPACAVARRVVSEHGALLAACEIDGVMVRVDVMVPVEPLPGWTASARAGARAGPVGWHTDTQH